MHYGANAAVTHFKISCDHLQCDTVVGTEIETDRSYKQLHQTFSSLFCQINCLKQKPKKETPSALGCRFVMCVHIVLLCNIQTRK